MILSGTYKIDVLQGTKPVLGSPFFCQAFDVSKVKLQELGPMTVSVHDHIVFKSMYFKIIKLKMNFSKWNFYYKHDIS